MSPKPEKIYLLSLGCPKNLVDSGRLVARLKAGADIDVTEDPSEAGTLLVNTCGFIEDAKKESIDEILRLARVKGARKLIVFGCLAERYGQELRKELPEVDALWGVGAHEEIARYLGGGQPPGDQPHSGQFLPVELPPTYPFAYLKISEGCRRRCTFCAIPSIRGPLRNFPPDEILGEAQAYVKLGVKELVLVSQDTASYNVKGYGLARLLRDLASINGDFWIRAHYLYPNGLSEELLAALASEEKIVKYLDIPVQHSEEKILRLMGRAGGAKELKKLPRRLRRMVPGLVLRTSVIVGFPGETEADFQGLLDFVHEARFEHLGAFMYSREDGTPAATLKPQVPLSVKRRRMDELMLAQAGISRGHNEALVGRTLRVLVEEARGKAATGRFYGQAPEVDGTVQLKSAAPLKKGSFMEARITGASDYDLTGRAV